MSKISNIEVNNAADRDQEVYQPRDEDDLEKLIEEAEEVEEPETAEAVETIREVVNDELRGVVRDHFEAPIRSLVNPEENSGVLKSKRVNSLENRREGYNFPAEDFFGEEKKNVQVAGEEFFVNQNLPGFQDVGNIKWWTVYDEGSYDEQQRNGGLEHLIFRNEGDMHRFHVEVDGESLDSEEVQRLAKNLRIRREYDISTRNGTPISDVSEIPEMVLDYKNITEAINASEDHVREDFKSRYEEAKSLGLVTEDANLTLKGWLSAVDLDARDLRQFEEIVKGEDQISLRNGRQQAFEHVLDSDNSITRGTANLNLTYPDSNVRILSEEYEGEVNNSTGEVSGELSVLKETLQELGIQYNSSILPDIWDKITFEQFSEVFVDSSEEIEDLEEHLEEDFIDSRSDNPGRIQRMLDDGLIEPTNVESSEPSVSIDYKPESGTSFEKEEGAEVLEENFDIDTIEKSLEKRLENLEFTNNTEHNYFEADYEGDDDFLKKYMEDVHQPYNRWKKLVEEDAEFEGSFDVVPLLIRSLEPKIERNDGEINYDEENESVRVENYNSLPEELRDNLEVIREIASYSKMTERGYENPELSFNVENKKEGKKVIEALAPFEEELVIIDRENSDYSEEEYNEFHEMKYGENWVREYEVCEEYEEGDYLEKLIGKDESIQLNESYNDQKKKEAEASTFGQSMGQEEINKLRELDREGLIEFEEPETFLEYVGGRKEITALWNAGAKMDYETNLDSNELDLAVLQNENETVYKASPELMDIAKALHPLKFDSNPYEEFEIETEFDYEEVRQPAEA